MPPWTKEEDNLLITNYQLKRNDLLKLFPNRSYYAVNQRASKLNLRKERNEYCESNLDVLLEETHEAYYWIGFILADGHVHKNLRLKITLAPKDTNHLQKLANFIKTQLKSNKYQQPYVSCQEKVIVPQLCKKFDIQQNKTTHPPKIFPTNLDLLKSLFIGYIDGDGSIKSRKKANICCLSIHIHKNWLNWLQQIQVLLNINSGKPKIINDGYTSWHISKHSEMVKLKLHAIKYKLPVLERKWSKINEHYRTMYEPQISEN